MSVKLFNDSKKLETIESQIRSFLYRYGEYDDKDTVLEEHNILKTPTYVMVKGKGILNFGQTIDLSKIDGDIGLSTKTLNQLCSVDLQGAEVVTIENLTNFHKFQPNNQLVIYLGGFHNSIKRDFIKRVDYCNPGTKFFNFGDIDAGGFYILYLKGILPSLIFSSSKNSLSSASLLKIFSYKSTSCRQGRYSIAMFLSGF